MRLEYYPEDLSNMAFVDECYIVTGQHFNVQNEGCHEKYL